MLDFNRLNNQKLLMEFNSANSTDAFSAMRDIEHDLLEMSSRAEVMFGRSVNAIVELRSDLIDWVFAADDKVDELDWKIETACLGLLASSSPEEVDLAKIGAILKIITDVERVGDLAVDISRCARQLDRQLGQSDVIDVPKIANIAKGMFHSAIEAYVRQDMALLTIVHSQEQEVDRLFSELRSQIYDLMKVQSEDVIGLAQLLIALHNIERVADHSVNIAIRVSYLITRTLGTHGKGS